MSSDVPTRPSVLFVCVHNAGRSQMAAGWLEALGGGQVEVRSAGSAPADTVNPAAVAAMAEVGNGCDPQGAHDRGRPGLRRRHHDGLW